MTAPPLLWLQWFSGLKNNNNINSRHILPVTETVQYPWAPHPGETFIRIPPHLSPPHTLRLCPSPVTRDSMGPWMALGFSNLILSRSRLGGAGGGAIVHKWLLPPQKCYLQSGHCSGTWEPKGWGQKQREIYGGKMRAAQGGNHGKHRHSIWEKYLDIGNSKGGPSPRLRPRRGALGCC